MVDSLSYPDDEFHPLMKQQRHYDGVWSRF